MNIGFVTQPGTGAVTQPGPDIGAQYPDLMQAPATI
jgi:hypothetical protein